MLAAAGYPVPDGDSEAEDAPPKAVDVVELERAADADDAASIPMSTISPTTTTLPSPSPHRGEPSAMNPGT